MFIRRKLTSSSYCSSRPFKERKRNVHGSSEKMSTNSFDSLRITIVHRLCHQHRLCIHLSPQRHAPERESRHCLSDRHSRRWTYLSSFEELFLSIGHILGFSAPCRENTGLQSSTVAEGQCPGFLAGILIDRIQVNRRFLFGLTA